MRVSLINGTMITLLFASLQMLTKLKGIVYTEIVYVSIGKIRTEIAEYCKH